MPGLVVFNRRWGIGSDDLVFPALAEIVVRVAWLIVVSIVYELHHDAMAYCEQGYLLQCYLLGVIVLIVWVIVVNVVIMIISMRGTIMNTEPRRMIPKLIVARAVLTIPEVIWNTIGTYWAFHYHTKCSNDVIVTVKATVIFSWFMLWVLMVAVALIFDPLGNEIYNQGSHVSIPSTSRFASGILENGGRNTWAHRVWEMRCRMMCCFMGDDNSQEAYKEVGRTIALFFQDLDIVPSDVAAGLVLLHQQERANLWEQASAAMLVGSSVPQGIDNITHDEKPASWQYWMTPELSAHYMKFAMACYGWPLYVCTHCKWGLCSLYKHWRCCGCIRRSPSYIVNDNCCQCNTAALKETTGMTDEDLIYVSFHNLTYEVPFYVAVDHQTCSVVVAIRGSLSMRDALTNLTCDSDILNVPELPPSLAAHKGMLQAARFVHRRLLETAALNDALALHQSYSLVLTGHSLGAGTAAILAFLLRPSYPNLRCFCFAPPGALLNRETAQFSEEFILSIVVGYDLTPRLNLTTMDELRRRLMRALYACHSPKYRVLINQCFDCCFGLGTQYEWSAVSTPGQGHPLLHDNNAGVHNATYESLSEIVHSCPSLSVPSMFMPGLILHFETSPMSDPDETPYYTATWAKAEKFNRIIVTPQMLSDHAPHTIFWVLQQYIKQMPLVSS